MRAAPFRELIDTILRQRNFAVVGASRDPQKYGHKVYQKLKEAGYRVFAVNPNIDCLDGDPVYPLLDTVPEPIDCVVTVVPPNITEKIILQAGRLHIPYAWMQPGSESLAAVNMAVSYGMRVVYGGPCIMVAVATHPVRA